MRSHWRWLAIILLVLGNWIYGVSVERAGFLARAAANNITLGPIYSDVYPRWRGAYELLRHGRNPYSPEVTNDIHEAMSGQPTALGDPPVLADAFAYPLYIVFMLAPLTLFPFEDLMPWLFIALLSLTALAVWGWDRMLGRPRNSSTPAFILLGCSTLAAVGAITQHQPVIISVACLAGAAAAITRSAASPYSERWQLLAGGLLALATIKPQCCVLLLPVLAVWVIGDFPRRRSLLFGFIAVLGVLLLASELLLPGWLPEWLAALRDYQQVITVTPLLQAFVPETFLPFVMAAGGLMLALLIWRLRRATADQLGFRVLFALPLVATYLVFPSWNYQQLLLYPAALIVLDQSQVFSSFGRMGQTFNALIANLILLPFLLETVGAIIWAVAVIQQHPAPYLPAGAVHTAIRLSLIATPFVLLPALGWLSWHSIRKSSDALLSAMTAAPEPQAS